MFLYRAMRTILLALSLSVEDTSIKNVSILPNAKF